MMKMDTLYMDTLSVVANLNIRCQTNFKKLLVGHFSVNETILFPCIVTVYAVLYVCLFFFPF